MPITDLIPWKREENKLAIRRNEEDPFSLMRKEMNQMFDSFLSMMPGFGHYDNYIAGVSDFMPSLDISENEKEIRVTVELPGMEDKDIQLSMTRDVLTISGEKKAEKEEKEGSYHRIERSYGSFQRSIQLPCEIDEKKVEAVFKNGVLTVKLGKSCLVQDQTKKITIKAG